MIARTLQDLRFAFRTLAKRPGFTAVALVILALGIGANTAVFSVVNAILLRQLPYSEPERTVAVWPSRFMSYHDLLYLRESAAALQDLGGIVPSWNMTLTGEGEPAVLEGARTTANLFAVLGVAPALGRSFLPEEALPGANDVVLLSHAIWRTRFGADSSLSGRRLVLDGAPHTVVGVMPAGFEIYQPDTEVWKPLAIDPEAWYHRGSGMLAIARLEKDVSTESARLELRALTGRMREEFGYPDAYGEDADVLALHEVVVGEVRPMLLVLLGSVGLILLIAGANLGVLLLARASGREREITVRAALGAGRSRLVRQLLTESATLSLAGGALGLLLAIGGVRVLRSLLPAGTPRAAAIALDLPTLVVCAAIALVTGLVFGLAPAFTATRGQLADALRGSRGVETPGVAGRRTRSALVVSQVAIALILLAGAGLMTQTLWRLGRVELGFRPENVLTLYVQPTGPQFGSGAQRLAFYSDVFERISALPNVSSVGAIQHLPLGGGSWGTDLDVEGRVLAPGTTPPRAGWRVVGGHYFRTLGIPLVAGRDFSASDREDVTPVVIVNEALASSFWPGESALGKRVRARRATGAEWATVIGIVGDVRHVGLDADAVPEIYRPIAQYPHGSLALVVRTTPDAPAPARAVSEAVWSVDPDVPITRIRTLDQVVSASVAQPRMMMLLLSAFAVVALTLGAVGIYGVIAYAVSQRRREIGIRVALGARAGSVVGMVLRQGIRYAAVGSVIGLAGALALNRVMAGLLFDVSLSDPFTLAMASLFLIGVAGLASYVPARRAARVDPMEALRD